MPSGWHCLMAVRRLEWGGNFQPWVKLAVSDLQLVGQVSHFYNKQGLALPNNAGD